MTTYRALSPASRERATGSHPAAGHQQAARPAASLTDRRPAAQAQAAQQALISSSPRMQALAQRQAVLDEGAQTQARSATGAVVQAVGWESLGRANPRRYLPVKLGGYTRQQMIENRLAAPAEERMLRWAERGRKRRAKGAIPTGEYDTQTGPIGESGGPGGRQRLTQTNKNNYTDADGTQHTLGALPSYADVKANMPDSALPLLLERQQQLPALTTKQKLATSLATGLVHASEEYREPGASKYIRGAARRRIARGASVSHPFDQAVNPSVKRDGGAEDMRQLLDGRRGLTPEQREVVDVYASDSSDEEAESYAKRRKLLTPRPK